jgi:hypothetical protein
LQIPDYTETLEISATNYSNHKYFRKVDVELRRGNDEFSMKDYVDIFDEYPGDGYHT